jgi:hypothetical protein
MLKGLREFITCAGLNLRKYLITFLLLAQKKSNKRKRQHEKSPIYPRYRCHRTFPIGPRFSCTTHRTGTCEEEILNH